MSARRSRLAVSILVLSLAAAALVSAPRGARAGGPPYLVEAVVLEGDPAPGTGGGVFAGIERTAGGQGRAFVFAASIAGGSSTSGLYRVLDGVLTPLRFDGEPTPAGGSYGLVSDPAIASNGLVVFHAEVAGGSTTEGIFRYGEGGDARVAAVGDPAPGSGGASFSALRDPAVNAQGDVVFHATLTGGTSTQGLYRVAGGVTMPVALEGELSPSGYVYGYFGQPHLGDGGEVVFPASHSGEAVLVRIQGGTAVAVAADWGVAPDTGGEVYGNWVREGFVGVDLADDGRISFVSVLSSCVKQIFHPIYGVIFYPYYCAVFEWDAGSVRLVARDGQPAPGGGGTFDTFSSSTVGGNGDLAFYMSGGAGVVPNPAGVYLEHAGVHEVLALKGEALADLPAALDPVPQNPQMNPQGAVLFTALYGGPVREEGLFLARLGAPVPALPGWAAAALAATLCALGAGRLAARRGAGAGPTPALPRYGTTRSHPKRFT